VAVQADKLTELQDKIRNISEYVGIVTDETRFLGYKLGDIRTKIRPLDCAFDGINDDLARIDAIVLAVKQALADVCQKLEEIKEGKDVSLGGA